MPYEVIQDFRLGLDRRKGMLTLPSGALFKCKNAHITDGGEIEKAKKFATQYTLPAGTFGLATLDDQLYVFGSGVNPGVPAGVIYQRLTHPSGLAMTEMVWAKIVGGGLYVIAAFSGGKLAHFFNGVLVTDWSDGTVSGGMSSNGDIASYLAFIINTDPKYSSSAAGAVITITGPPGVNFSCTPSAINGGAINDQTATLAVVQASTPQTNEVLSHGTFQIAGAAGFGTIADIKVNGVDILGGAVNNPGTDGGFAIAVRDKINANSSSPDYTATVSGGLVTINAMPGTGATPNGFVVTSTHNLPGPGVITMTNFIGGVTLIPGLPQIVTVTIGGTFELGDTFTIVLDGVVFGGALAGGEVAPVVIGLGGKAYAIAGPNLFGGTIGNPADWNGTGSFIIDMSSEVAGTERLTALGIYQNHLSVFSRKTTQIWAVDPDPELNDQLQVLDNIGTMAPKTVHQFGDADQFFLSDTGVRSLRVRDTSLSANISDIGSPIDSIIKAAIVAAGAAVTKACGVITPVSGRYWIHIGQTTYVFSFFPNGRISAWSTYEKGLSITDFAVATQRVYARAGNIIYLYGGDNDNEYDTTEMEVILPFVSARRIATVKHFTAFDLAAEGHIHVYVALDPNQPDVWEEIAITTEATFGLDSVTLNGESEMVAFRFVCTHPTVVKIASLIVHYEQVRAD